MPTRGARPAAAERRRAPSVYVLKMGQPVRIMELAERMIRLAGFEPGVDIEIAVTGVRAGRAAQRDPVRPRRADGRDRHRRASWRPSPSSPTARRIERLAGALRTAVAARRTAPRPSAVFEAAIPDFTPGETSFARSQRRARAAVDAAGGRHPRRMSAAGLGDERPGEALARLAPARRGAPPRPMSRPGRANSPGGRPSPARSAAIMLRRRSRAPDRRR